MNLINETLLQASFESTEDNAGYKDQPVVAVYVPAVDGDVNPLVDMDVQGASVFYREWQGHATLEGMQQINQHLNEVALDAVVAAAQDSDVRESTHIDYNLFVIDPAIQPNWYETLGEVKDLTGALLTGNLSEYQVGAVDALSDALGMENIFTSVGQACVRIERVLHAQSLKEV